VVDAGKKHGELTGTLSQQIAQYDAFTLTDPCSTKKVRFVNAALRRSNTCQATMRMSPNALISVVFRRIMKSW
jgi:hypothetical protein